MVRGPIRYGMRYSATTQFVSTALHCCAAFTPRVLHFSAFHFSQYDTNRFQGVLITDGYYSYAVFIYQCGDMEWGGGVIGWQASTSHYASYYLSGESNSNDVACANSYYSSYNTLVFRLDDRKSLPPSIPPMYHLFPSLSLLLLIFMMYKLHTCRLSVQHLHMQQWQMCV